MNSLTELNTAPVASDAARRFRALLHAGKVVEGTDETHRSRDLGVTFATPKLDLDALVHPAHRGAAAAQRAAGEIIDFLVETGQKLRDPNNPSCPATASSGWPRSASRRARWSSTRCATPPTTSTSKAAERSGRAELPRSAALDEWVPHTDSPGRKSFIRALRRG